MGCGEDDIWQVGNGICGWDGQSVAQIIPECNFELGAGFGEAEEGIAAVTAEITAGYAAELSPGDVQRMSFSDPLVCSGISGR